MMARKILLTMAVGVFFVILAGVAKAEAPVNLAMTTSDEAIQQSSADPELVLGQEDSWQAREPVETGALPDMSSGSTDWKCCTDNDNFRAGIDDGQ